VAIREISDSFPLFTTQGGLMPLHMSLVFRNYSEVAGAFGRGWGHNYDLQLVEELNGNVVYRKGLLRVVFLISADGSSYLSPSGYHMTLNKESGGYTLTELEGDVYRFDLTGRILSHTDRFGNQLLFDHGVAGQLTVTDPLGRSLTLYDDDADSKLDRLIGPGGGEWSFTYDPASARLQTVSAPAAMAGAERAVWRFAYDAQGRMQSKYLPGAIQPIEYVY